MIRSILQLGNETLRKKSSLWTDFRSKDLACLIKDLSDTLHDAQQRYGYGRGLAASQINTLKRVIFIDTKAFHGPLVNPIIAWKSDEQFEVWDSCFSFNVAFFVLVDRDRSIKVQYCDHEGETHLLTADNSLSELVQHEIDHLDGILAIDRMKNKRMIMRSEWQSAEEADH
jgi:peptide deformylase